MKDSVAVETKLFKCSSHWLCKSTGNARQGRLLLILETLIYLLACHNIWSSLLSQATLSTQRANSSRCGPFGCPISHCYNMTPHVHMYVLQSQCNERRPQSCVR